MSDLPALDFSDAPVPVDGPVNALGQLDAAPSSDHEYACVVCGKELFYGGRGRKPKYCEDHRKASGGKSTRSVSGKNQALAASATEALCQINTLSAFGLMMFGMPLTAESITNAEQGFREQAYAALLTNPSLCQKILKAGTTSGTMALVMAYGMLGVAVGPVAYGEVTAKRREAQRLAAESDEM